MDKLTEFVTLVKATRAAQKNFYKAPTGSESRDHWLKRSKECEKEVDAWIKNFEQPALFDSGGNMNKKNIETIQDLCSGESKFFFVDDKGNRIGKAGKDGNIEPFKADLLKPFKADTGIPMQCCCVRPHKNGFNDCCPEHGNLSGHCINAGCLNFSKDEES